MKDRPDNSKKRKSCRNGRGENGLAEDEEEVSELDTVLEVLNSCYRRLAVLSLKIDIFQLYAYHRAQPKSYNGINRAAPQTSRKSMPMQPITQSIEK